MYGTHEMKKNLTTSNYFARLRLPIKILYVKAYLG